MTATVRNFIILIYLGLFSSCYTKEAPAIPEMNARDVNEAVVNDIVAKGVDLSRWATIGKSFQFIDIGMPRADVYRLLGVPDAYPEDKTSIVQYSPDGDFRGGSVGPDWSLRIHFMNDKVSKVEFAKGVFGPAPGGQKGKH